MADKYGTKEKKSYLKYYKQSKAKGQTPAKFGTYRKARGDTERTQQAAASLAKSGLGYADIARLRGKK